MGFPFSIFLKLFGVKIQTLLPNQKFCIPFKLTITNGEEQQKLQTISTPSMAGAPVPAGLTYRAGAAWLSGNDTGRRQARPTLAACAYLLQELREAE